MADDFTLRGEVGIIVVPALRSLVSKAQFQGCNVRLWLGPGWFSKAFELSGDARVVRKIYDLLIEDDDL